MRLIRRHDERLFTLQRPPVKVGCIFQVEKFRNDGTITYKGPKFHNVVLDVGLDGLAEYSLGSLTAVCRVGTGSSEPATNQSGLDSYLASADSVLDTVINKSIGDPIWVSRWRKWEFSIGSCTGNLTEVSLYGEGIYFNRQLFRDELGNSVTITVADDEGLRVDGEVFMYFPMIAGETFTGSFLLNDSTTINYTMEMHTDKIDSEPGWGISPLTPGRGYIWLSDVYAGFDADVSGRKEGVADDYTVGTFERTFTATVSPGAFVGTVRRIAVGDSWGSYAAAEFFRLFQFRLDNTFDIADDEELTVNFKSSWGRYDDYES